MKYNFDELTDRINSILNHIQQYNDTTEYVYFYIPNEQYYRDRFKEKVPQEKWKYVKIDNGNYIVPKQMWQYFKTILTKNHIDYEYIGE